MTMGLRQSIGFTVQRASVSVLQSKVDTSNLPLYQTFGCDTPCLRYMLICSINLSASKIGGVCKETIPPSEERTRLF